jgi:hypothetical protein
LESGLDPWDESSLPREVRGAGYFSVGFDAKRPAEKLPLAEAEALRSGVGSETKDPPKKVLFSEALRSCSGPDTGGPPKRELLAEALRSGVGMDTECPPKLLLFAESRCVVEFAVASLEGWGINVSVVDLPSDMGDNELKPRTSGAASWGP